MFRLAASGIALLAMMFSPALGQSRSGCAVLYNAQEREIISSSNMAEALKGLSPDVFFDRDANDLTRRMTAAHEQVAAARLEYIAVLERYAQNLRVYQRLLEECSIGSRR